MTKEEKLKKIDEWEERCSAYGFALGLIGIDANAKPPIDGSKTRNKYTSVLAGEAFDIRNDKEIYETLKELEKEDGLSDFDKRRVSLLINEMEAILLVPKEVYIDYQNTLSDSREAWLKYKNEADWKSYAPYLENLVKAHKEMNSYRNIEGDIYDVLLDDNQEGWNIEKYDNFFNNVKEGLLPFLEEIKKQPQIDDSFLFQKYDLSKQREFMKVILDYIGFKDNWGKIGESEHPLTSGLCRNDIRFTTKYYENDPVAAILSTVHEIGHAYFGHQIDEKYEGTVISHTIGAATHESQSRFCENHLGRSRAFWQVNYPKLQSYFNDELKGISLDDFYRAISKVEPTLVRMQADEVTYPFHIMIRYEIEKLLFNNKISVFDLEEAWNEKYKEYLGLEVPNAREGILQDMHWPYAYFGYFPTYALGSAFAAQFYNQLCKEKDVEILLLNNEYTTIMEWLKNNIHHYANMKSGDQVLEEVTGESFNSKYYIDYLKNKYSKIYNI